ncbi:MAG: hypothetical protein U1E62_10305 [Alsobacter sp.]
MSTYRTRLITGFGQIGPDRLEAPHAAEALASAWLEARALLDDGVGAAAGAGRWVLVLEDERGRALCRLPLSQIGQG